MTFIPGSHSRLDLPAQDLTDPRDLFVKSPDLTWEPRMTVPLRAGDCTFHHALCAHMATPNITDEPRVAHVVIFMDAETTYHKMPHPVTDPLNLEEGAPLDGDLFPRLDDS
jgi:ectoine hydroxylase-related dioxygenase (phytanoyl-CoA dioxygenase family)